MKLKRLGIRLLTLCTAAALMLGTGASAVESSAAADRQEDLNTLYTTLKTVHPNLYANTPESSFLARKAEIEQRISTESDFDFALDCASLAALTKDSHTSVSLGSSIGEMHYLLFDMDHYGAQWILSAVDSAHKQLLGSEVTAINDCPMETVLQKFGTFLSADNPVKLRYSYWNMCYVLEPYQYLGIGGDEGSLTLTLKDKSGAAQTLTVGSVTPAQLKTADLATLPQAGTPATAYDKHQFYFSKALNASTYYIQYNQCFEDPNLPMSTFCDQIAKDLSAGSYSVILVDLRHNGGGSDGVISPLLQLLMGQRDKGVQVAALIGEQTFSSAIINSVELEEMGFPLVGEETSGSINHFGSVSTTTLPNSGLKLNISTKYISLAGYCDVVAGTGVESLQPDVPIAQTLSDTLTGRDTCVDAILSNPSILQSADHSSDLLTRGRFAGQLYEQAGSPAQQFEELPFEDLFGFEWHVPALNWVKTQKIAQGTGENCFASYRVITWQEASVLLVRTASALNLTRQAVRSSVLPASLKTQDWNRSAVQQAWAWGLLPENADFSSQPTRAQGEAMVTALFAGR